MSHKIRLDKVHDKAKKAILNHFKNKSKSCHVEMPTGTGKTNLGMKVLKSLEKTSKKSKRVLWLTQTEELIEQTVLDLSNKFKSKSVGLIQRDVFDINCDIIVASVQTLTKDKNLSKIPDNYFYLVIVDEAHHGGAVTWSKIINKFDSYLLGLTATAYRMDGTLLDSLFGKCVFKLSYQEAVDLKIIAEDDALVVFTSSLLNGVTFDGEDYAPHHLEKLVTSEERNKNIVKAYKKYGRKKMDSHGLRYKTVCFCVDIKHAVALSNYFNIEGIPSEILCSKSEYQSPKDREYVWDLFKKTHEIEVLCVVDILNEGKNVPDIGCVLLSRPTASAIVYPQQLGRATRFIENYKSKFVVLDFVDNTHKAFYLQNISRFKKSILKSNEYTFEYYTGSDPIVSVDSLLDSLYCNVEEFKKSYIWTYEDAEKAIRKYVEEHGDISTAACISENGLPSRRTIDIYFGSFNGMRLHFNLDTKTVYKYQGSSKEGVLETLKEFYNKNGSLKYNDLGSKNNLPSIKKIRNLFGNLDNCLKHLGLIGYWSKQNVLLTTLEFLKINKLDHIKSGYFSKTSRPGDLILPKSGMPSYDTVKKCYGSWPCFLEELSKKIKLKNINEVIDRSRRNTSFEFRRDFIVSRLSKERLSKQTILGIYRGRFFKKNEFAKKEIKKLIRENIISEKEGFFVPF